MLMPVRDVVLLAAVLPFILGILMAIYWRSRRVYPGFGYWIVANLSLGLSYLLFGLRDRVPDFFSIVLANLLAVYCLVAIYEGTEAFFGRRSFNVLNYALLALYVPCQLYLTYIHPGITARVILASAVLGTLSLRVVQSLLAHSPARLRSTCRTIALVFLLSALFSLGRGVYALTRAEPLLPESDPTLLAAAFGSICAITIWSFYFLFLNSARVEIDLEDASQKLAQSAENVRRELGQLALLEEAGQLISDSLDEQEILRRAVEAVVSCFGYAEAAVSMLVGDGQLELAAVSGTEDIGFHPGYRQKLGDGIIGYVGLTKRAYVTGDIEHDPHYFSIGQRSGSAAGIPLVSEGNLYGVLYVESSVRDAFTDTEVQTLRTLAGHMVTAINKARLYGSTQDHLVVMTTLHRVSQIISSSLELDRIFQTVVQLLKDTFGYTHVSIYLLDGNILRLGAQIGYPWESVLNEIPITQGIIGRTARTKQLQFVPDVSQDPAFLRVTLNIQSEICAPLFKEGNVLGVLNVEAAGGQILTGRDADVLTALAGPITIAIENAHLHAEAQSLARIDGLTELLNRRTFDQVLVAELARAARYDYPLTLLILDIDDFKACNDQWGHPAGDSLLRATAQLIRKNIRSSDSAARYGGDEFAIILPNTSLSDGLEMGDRLRIMAAKIPREPEDQTRPPGEHTISVGVASYPENGLTAEELLVAADLAELTAKKLGKNRVCTARTTA
jgi:diguanylate cyclase (GGDEF)-like protein